MERESGNNQVGVNRVCAQGSRTRTLLKVKTTHGEAGLSIYLDDSKTGEGFDRVVCGNRGIAGNSHHGELCDQRGGVCS